MGGNIRKIICRTHQRDYPQHGLCRSRASSSKIDLPIEHVQASFDALQAEIKMAGPDAFERLDEVNNEFLAARAKPKN